MNNWFEELPEKCPPKDAVVPNGQVFYRLINGQEPTSDDFISVRVEKPLAIFKGVDECLARAVSIFAQRDECENILKLARHRHKRIFELDLYKHDGVIKKTFKLSHHSWWRTPSFKINNDK